VVRPLCLCYAFRFNNHISWYKRVLLLNEQSSVTIGVPLYEECTTGRE